jgi:phosphoglycolate phosphatase-like HAD superfamily hydrolase
MLEPLRAVFFDVDGVLLDSLPQHLLLARDKAATLGLNLDIPTVEGFRDLVNRGANVSPMVNFFIAVGFPTVLAERAVEDYDEFNKRYRPPVFPGVPHMLETLRDAGLKLGLVTSNTRANIEPALGRSMHYFEKSCVFCLGDLRESATPKSDALKSGARLLHADPSACFYVGDLPADALAAQEAGFPFLGASYGWGIKASGNPFYTVGSVSDIELMLSSTCVSA